MLWLCAHYPQLPLTALPKAAGADDAQPQAVVARRGSRSSLLVLNAAALGRGLQPGMSLPGALSLVPELTAHSRQLPAERAALEAQACWAYGYGAPVTLCAARFAVWVEIGQSLRLFGSWKALAQALLASTDEAGSPAQARQLGVAPTQAAAFLLASASAKPRAPIRRMADISKALGHLPLELLPLGEEATALLQGAGLRRIGEVLAIPAAELAARIGAEQHLALQRLLGAAPEVWARWEPPTVYRRRFDFAEPIETTETLLFPLKHLLGEFVHYLKARSTAIQQFSLRLVDTRKRVLRHPVGLLAPTQDAARLLLVLREQLDRLRLEDAVTEVTLEAHRFEPANGLQDELFAGSQSPLQAERLTELRERLIARLGADAVRQLQVSPDQRPEQATLTASSSSSSSSNLAIKGEEPRHPPRPLWLLNAPRRVAAPVKILSPAERIELGWWQGEQAARDYFLAEDARQRLCWVYRSPEAPEHWYLHGLWQ